MVNCMLLNQNRLTIAKQGAKKHLKKAEFFYNEHFENTKNMYNYKKLRMKLFGSCLDDRTMKKSTPAFAVWCYQLGQGIKPQAF